MGKQKKKLTDKEIEKLESKYEIIDILDNFFLYFAVVMTASLLVLVGITIYQPVYHEQYKTPVIWMAVIGLISIGIGRVTNWKIRAMWDELYGDTK